MTHVQAVKYGFLLRLAEEGVPPGPETERRIAGARALLRKQGNPLLYALGLPLGAAAVAGIGAGHAAARLQEPPLNLDEASNNELIDAYNEQARRAQIRRLLGTHRPPPKRHYAYGK